MIAQLKHVLSLANRKSIARKTFGHAAALALASVLMFAPLAGAEETGLAPPATADVPAPAPDMGGMTAPAPTAAEPAPEPTHRARKHAKKKAGKKAHKGKKHSKKKKKKKKHTEY
ncbi:MAG: hypothetical protein H7301_07320 [Cryobacterium sp.]|nr:hypothetical protein [Oligoflexia bacterium]